MPKKDAGGFIYSTGLSLVLTIHWINILYNKHNFNSSKSLLPRNLQKKHEGADRIKSNKFLIINIYNLKFKFKFNKNLKIMKIIILIC